MKKSLKNIMLAAVLSVPCAFAFTGCDEEHTHNFAETYSISDTHHWKECECGEREGEEKHSGGEATCSVKAVCEDCGESYGELLVHTYNKMVSTDEYRASEPDCDTKGTYYYSCECGAKGTETYEAGTYKHVFNKQVTTSEYKASDATCTNKASYYYSCECGEKGTLTFEHGEKLPHDLDADGICNDCHENAVACIGEGSTAKYYKTLAEAVNSATDGVKTTIKLFKDAMGNGVKVQSGKNIVFDLNGYTYTLDGTMVGSTGTETNGFQLLKGSTVEFKNGSIKQGVNGCKTMIINYANTTIENVTLDATNENGTKTCDYVLSNNCGTMLVKGNTNIIAPEGEAAFDLWYGMFSVYDEGVAVTFDDTFTGRVEGRVEYGAHSRVVDEDWEEKAVLTIRGNGMFQIGELSINANADAPTIKIYGGLFDINVSDYRM